MMRVGQLVWLLRRARTGAGFFGAEGGVEKRGGDAAGLQGVHLVFHQGDEGRDDDGEPVASEGGQLEAERFSAAGREEGEHIFADEIGLDDFALQRPERGVAEGRLEKLRERGHGEGRFRSPRNTRKTRKECRRR